MKINQILSPQGAFVMVVRAVVTTCVDGQLISVAHIPLKIRQPLHSASPSKEHGGTHSLDDHTVTDVYH